MICIHCQASFTLAADGRDPARDIAASRSGAMSCLPLMASPMMPRTPLPAIIRRLSSTLWRANSLACSGVFHEICARSHTTSSTVTATARLFHIWFGSPSQPAEVSNPSYAKIPLSQPFVRGAQGPPGALRTGLLGEIPILLVEKFAR